MIGAAVPQAERWPLGADAGRGLVRLGVQAVTGLTDVAEAMHHTIASGTPPLGRPPAGRTRGLTGLVYGAVRGTTRLAGHGLEAVAGLLPSTGVGSPQREAWRAALNGVLGDHLAATGNPLAIPMQWRSGGRPWAEVANRADSTDRRPGGRVLVLVHGLAMNDLQWTRHGHDHGQALARAAGWTPVYLHYNTGLHVAENGRLLSQRLAELLAAWPVPVTELAIVGHSTGGLVARSACHVGARRRWRRHLTRLVCLGTPHHGAPLERGGHLFDLLLEASPYAAPLARLGRLRSAGITDLRHGRLLDADELSPDRRAVPLPRGVDSYVVAVTLAAMADRPERLHRKLAHGLHERLVGDGLVPLASALGEHRQPALALKLPASHRLIVPSASHWDLLNHPQVTAALKRWLA